MSILIANLKHLYQRRGYWLVYIVFGLIAYLGVTTALKYSGMRAIDMMMSGVTGMIVFMLLGEAHFMGLVLLAFPIGVCAASVPVDVLSKPFSYCLPGHQKVPVKFVLSIGIVTNVLGSLLFLAYPNLNAWQKALVVCSAFGAGSMMYWLGVWSSWGTKYSAISLPFLLPAVFMVPSVLKLNVIAEQVIVEAPFEVAVLGVLTSLMGWWLLTNKTHARQFCDVPRLGLFDLWNAHKVQRYMQSTAFTKKIKPKLHRRLWIERLFLNWTKQYPSPWIEEFFLNRMNRCGYLGVGRNIWGGLYTTFAVVLSEWKWNLVLLLSFGWFFCYIDLGRASMIFIFPAIIVANMTPPIRTSAFTPQGRKERFITAVVVGGTIAMLTTAVMTSITALSVVLAPIMPIIRSLTFHALDTRALCLFILAMPGALTLQVILHRKPALMRLSIFMLLVLSVSIPGLLFSPDAPTLLSMLLEPILKPIPIATFVVLSWLVFASVLWYVCMKRPLVGQSKTY